MTLRQKTLATYALTIIVVIAVGYIAARAIVLGSFARLEQEMARQNVARATNVLSNTIAALDIYAGDWAQWDDTYRFVADANAEYIASNLVDETFGNVRLNVMVFINASGDVMHAKSYDLDMQTETPIAPGLLAAVASDESLWKYSDVDGGTAGILLLPEGAMLVASRAIVHSDGSGPVRGALLMGRYLGTTEIEEMARTTILSVAVRRVDDEDLPAGFSAARSLLSSPSLSIVQPVDGHVVAGYGLLPDIYGQPSLILRIEMPRDIYQQGERTTLLIALTVAVAGLVSAVYLLLHLDRMILSPLAKLGADINGVGEYGRARARVGAAGSDEIGDLSRAINRMLTALEQSQNEAQEATTRYQRLFAEVQTGVLVIDAATRTIVDANSAALRMIGASRGDVIGQPCRRYCPDDYAACALGDQTPGMASAEGVLLTASGERVPVLRAAASVQLAGQTHLLESMVDISQRKQHEGWLTHLAFHDPLTDAPNRRSLEDALVRAIADADSGPAALIMLDLDRFKPVNDTSGHLIGDQVLVALTRVMQRQVRSSDILARLGGDEFAVLLPRTTIADARVIAERIRSAVEAAPCSTDDGDFHLTASVGIVAVDGSLSPRELMAKVDAAMYEAKEGGRNRIEVR